jgi:hypothetical protein
MLVCTQHKLQTSWTKWDVSGRNMKWRPDMAGLRSESICVEQNHRHSSTMPTAHVTIVIVSVLWRDLMKVLRQMPDVDTYKYLIVLVHITWHRYKGFRNLLLKLVLLKFCK